MYKVEKDWTSKAELRCVVIMTDMGHRCGYVGVTNIHPFYGKGYSDPAPIEEFEKVAEGDIGKRGVIDLICCDPDKPHIGILFNVHGGITYSAGSDKYPVKSNLWWFGYDCAHCDDSKDLSEMSDAVREIELQYPTGGIVRSLDYCIQECESLAEQLMKITNKIKE